jgi:cytidylate kinase
MSLITISESIGCGGKAIAGLVADELKMELYDDRRLEEEAIQLGIKPKDVNGLDEKAPGLFSRIFSDKPQVYLDVLEGVVYEVATRGKGIILGHGSQVLLRDFGCALHVRIDGSESSRIEYLINQRGLSREATEKLIHKTDNEQRGFLQFAFHMNWNDPSLYDLVINRDKLSTGLAAKFIIEAARSQEIKECSMTALESMERLSLSRRVDGAVLESNLSPEAFRRDMLHIEVHEKGVVRITGVTHVEGADERLLTVVKGVPGVTDVRSNVVVVPPGAE